MSMDICKAIFRKLATQGEVFTSETFRTIKATYFRVALDFIETYSSDARMNGLTLDRHSEEKAVELFAQNIMAAGSTEQNKYLTVRIKKSPEKSGLFYGQKNNPLRCCLLPPLHRGDPEYLAWPQQHGSSLG